MIEQTLHLTTPAHLPGLEVSVMPKGHPQVNIYPKEGVPLEIADAAECRALAEVLEVAARRLEQDDETD